MALSRERAIFVTTRSTTVDAESALRSAGQRSGDVDDKSGNGGYGSNDAFGDVFVNGQSGHEHIDVEDGGLVVSMIVIHGLCS